MKWQGMMSIDILYDDFNDCLVLKALRDLGLKEIIALRDQLISHPRFRTNINQILDCSAVKLHLSTEELKEIASYYLEVNEQLGTSRKLALVVMRDLDFGMMRQYEAFFYSGPDVRIHSFYSLNDAKDWVRKV